VVSVVTVVVTSASPVSSVSPAWVTAGAAGDTAATGGFCVWILTM
jgi:hypothetical protein